MNQATYRVVRGSIKLPRDPKATRTFTTQGDFLKQGDVIPEGVLSPEQLRSFLKDGRIEILRPAEAEAVKGRPKTRGRWSVDPSALAGKNLEDLLVMVLEIDPDFDVSEMTTEADAVRQLTENWDPAFRDTLTRATDKSRPEQLKLKTTGNEVRVGMRDAGERPMSDAAQRALERARAKASPDRVVELTDISGQDDPSMPEANPENSPESHG